MKAGFKVSEFQGFKDVQRARVPGRGCRCVRAEELRSFAPLDGRDYPGEGGRPDVSACAGSDPPIVGAPLLDGFFYFFRG